MGYYKTPNIRYRMRDIERPSHGMFSFLALNYTNRKNPPLKPAENGLSSRARAYMSTKPLAGVCVLVAQRLTGLPVNGMGAGLSWP